MFNSKKIEELREDVVELKELLGFKPGTRLNTLWDSVVYKKPTSTLIEEIFKKLSALESYLNIEYKVEESKTEGYVKKPGRWDHLDMIQPISGATGSGEGTITPKKRGPSKKSK